MRSTDQLQATLAVLAARVGVTEEELLSRSHISRISDARSLVAAALTDRAGVRQVDIAALLGTSQAAVSKMLGRHKLYMHYVDYRRKWESLNE